MFKNIANKVKSIAFKAQKLDPNSSIAKAQSKIIDELTDQAQGALEIAVEAAEKIASDAKKEVAKAVKQASSTKPKKVGPRPEDADRAASSTAKKNGPKKTTK